MNVESFRIINDGIIINQNHKLVFSVEGGELDVNFYEWSNDDNIIGLSGDASQNLVFKITVDNQKRYLEYNNSYFLDTIPISTEEINVSYVYYSNGEETDIVVNTIEKTEWYNAKFMEIEYETSESKGIIYGNTLAIRYWHIFVLMIILGAIWYLMYLYGY